VGAGEEKALEPLDVPGFTEEAVEEDEYEEFAAPAAKGVPSGSPEWAPRSVGTMDLGQVDIAGLEQQLAQSPNDPFAHRALGEGLITAGSKERGLYELELALAGFEARQDWGRSTDVLRELVRLDPNRIWYYQKRVELAFRSGEKGRLVEAYLELGDVLVRVGSLEKALAVYGRVLEHDPANEFAQAALDVLRPVRPADMDQPARPSRGHAPDAGPERSEEEYVDLGALVLEPRPRRDTRIRVGDEEPTGDEERDFELMLEQFKAALEESLTDEDYQAHYDLGVAFKEMGLLDEAIAEFQKALRAPEGRLRTSEALGVSFYEKGQYAVAEAILRRAVDGISGLDDEKIGLLYWLGRSTESLGRVRDALSAYERAMAVDVGFMDINERVRRLEAGSA
jgi:tetratricopeptide (TPR) repeat protein